MESTSTHGAADRMRTSILNTYGDNFEIDSRLILVIIMIESRGSVGIGHAYDGQNTNIRRCGVDFIYKRLCLDGIEAWDNQIAYSVPNSCPFSRLRAGGPSNKIGTLQPWPQPGAQPPTQWIRQQQPLQPRHLRNQLVCGEPFCQACIKKAPRRVSTRPQQHPEAGDKAEEDQRGQACAVRAEEPRECS